MEIENRQIPKWLKNLQENSWELEILISGGAIFSLLQFSDYFIEWIQYIRLLGAFPGMGIIMIVGIFAIKTLTIGFILHLLFRAIWLALVCVNYVHPSGINKEKIKWKKPFNQEKIDSDLQNQITKIDGYCGTIMYMSIISVIIIFGFLISFSILFIMIYMTEINNDSFISYFIPFFLVTIGVYFLDLITFGLLRKTPYLSYLLFPIFKFFDVLTLRFFYQDSLLMQSTNVNKVTFFLKVFAFASVSVCLTYLSVYRTMHWPNLFDQREFRGQLTKSNLDDWTLNANENYYMSNWEEKALHSVGIDAKKQTSNLMEVFVAYSRHTDELIHQINVPDSLKTLDQIIDITIDDSLSNNLDWVSSKTLWGTKGITTMVPITHLDNGLHIINIYTDYKSKNWSPDHGDKEIEIKIPFWVDK